MEVKVWAVIFVSLQVKAVKIFLANGLSNENFLLIWNSFIVDFGQSLVAYIDRSSNLGAAAKQGGDTVGSLPEYSRPSIIANDFGKTA